MAGALNMHYCLPWGMLHWQCAFKAIPHSYHVVSGTSGSRTSYVIVWAAARCPFSLPSQGSTSKHSASMPVYSAHCTGPVHQYIAEH
eukprot:1626455-Lingulodinium_polyedra.AAC.1